MKKKIIIAIVALLALVFIFSLSVYKSDRNLFIKKFTKKISLDETAEVEFDYGKKTYIRRSYIPVYLFTSPEDGEYTFSVTDINTEEDVFITMTVCDTDLNEYFSSDNFEEHNGDVSGSEFISKDNKCLLIIDAVSNKDGSKDRYTGSLKVTVSKKEDAKPLELTEENPVTVNTGNEEMTSVMFAPKETGYYRFETKILSGKDENGFSSIAAIKDSDNKEVKVTENISYLEGGVEYYVWIGASELSKKSADISVSCSMVNTIKADSPGSFELDEETIIGFKPKKGANYVIYSSSEGNVDGAVYDDKGFPLNKDDNSGGTLSENKEDFALVLQAKDKTLYLIHISGKFDKCTVNIAEYIGDGTTLGPDDIKQPSSDTEDEEQTQPSDSGDGDEEAEAEASDEEKDQ